MIVYPRRPAIWLPGDTPEARSTLFQGMVLYYPCNEGGGTNLADLARRTPGTYSGTTPAWEQSPYGPALKLDGSTNFVNVPFATGVPYDITVPELSLGIWLFWRASTDAYNVLFEYYSGSSPGWTFMLKSNQLPAFYSGPGADPVGSTVVPFNQWVHLVLTYDTAGNVIVYQNGVALGTTSVASSSTHVGTPLTIGKSGAGFGSGRFLNGSIRDAGIWNRALQPSEVQALYLLGGGALLRRPRRFRAGVGGPTPGQITIAAGIPSGEAFGCGTAVNNDGDQSITICSGIPSAEAFGVQPSLSTVPNIAIAVGIPSAEVVGTPSLAPNPSIVIANGIPSAEKVNSPALIHATQRPVSVFLAGADVTNLILASSASFGQGLQITDPLTGPSTAVATLYDPAGLMHPAVGQEFLVYRGTVRIFGGQIEQSTESAYQATKAVIAALSCSDFSQILDRRIVGTYLPEGQGGNLEVTVSGIVQNFLSADGITYNPVDGDPGTDLGIQLFNWITARQALTQIAQKTGWDFRVDPYRVLRFFPHTTGIGSAPFAIAQNDGNVLAEGTTSLAASTAGTTVRTYRGKYANRFFILANTQPNPLWCEEFSAAHPGLYPSSPQAPDGNRILFVTFYEITKPPQVAVNGVAQRVVALQDIATLPYDWYWGIRFGVAQNQANPRLSSSDVLVVCYETQLSPVTVVQDNAQIVARAAIEGNSGFYDDVAQAQDILDPAGIAAYGAGLLARFGSSGIPREVVYTTTPNRHGLQAGQLQQIALSSPLVPSGLYLILNLVTNEVDKTYLQYVVTATTGANPGDWTAFFAALQRRSQLTLPSAYENHTWQIAPSYAGITNPGAVGGIQGQPYIIQNAEVLLQFVTVYFTSPPTGGDLPVNVVLNGSFALGIVSPTYPKSSTSPQTFYFQQPQRAFAGDVLQVYVGDVGGPGKNGRDGVFTVVMSVAA